MSDTINADEPQGSVSSPQPIGISFGNSYSSIAYTTVDGKSEVIANEEGDRQIPAILSYVAGEEFVGTQAKAQLVRNPRNTIAFFRDFLGKGFDKVDVTPCHGSAHAVPVDGGKTVGFEVIEKPNEDDEEEAQKSLLSVEEVTSRQFKRLRESASDFLGYDVKSAVVTIPTDFSEQQTAALSAAAKSAGIDIIQTISEPVAALLAHDAKQNLVSEDSSSAIASDHKQQDQVIVVADLGSTRSDIAVFASRGGIYTTLATAHDQSLGGSALDQTLIEYAAKEFLKKNKSAEDPRKNDRGLAKLKLEAEAVKKALSIGASANFSIESLVSGIDFSLTVNRTRFELLANKVLAQFTHLIETAVKKADLDPLDVDAILLSGGTSHVPKIASNLAATFPETTSIIAPSTSAAAVNPSELAARGAAIQASLIREFEQSDIEASTEAVVTVTPHISSPIGLITKSGSGDGFVVIVPADTPVPARRTVQLTVPAGGDVFLQLAQGTREIKVTKEEKSAAAKADDDEDDDDDDDDDDEPEEVREKVFKAGKVLAEIGVKGVKKGSKVEIQVNIAADLAITAVCREVGGKGGVRGVVQAPATTQNGAAA